MIGFAAASQSAQQVASMLGGPASSDRRVQDQLNELLAAKSKPDLWEVLRLLKEFLGGDKEAAKRYFADRPGLTKAVFQAQVLLGECSLSLELTIMMELADLFIACNEGFEQACRWHRPVAYGHFGHFVLVTTLSIAVKRQQQAVLDVAAAFCVRVYIFIAAMHNSSSSSKGQTPAAMAWPSFYAEVKLECQAMPRLESAVWFIRRCAQPILPCYSCLQANMLLATCIVCAACIQNAICKQGRTAFCSVHLSKICIAP
eukprot:GHRR01022389.1.p1 GENE.GHRR01022389.1~~GHRR01022389.1.p1  ORF type:complete len:258 (+),score=67.30 GHRR01022389.1:910-1683(+)